MQKESYSLHWLLEEPLIHGAQLDITSSTAPTLTRLLISTKTVKLRQLVELSGPDFTHPNDIASQIGMRSVCLYCTGVISPEEGENNPHLTITPRLSDVSGSLLGDGEETVSLNTASGKRLPNVSRF